MRSLTLSNNNYLSLFVIFIADYCLANTTDIINLSYFITPIVELVNQNIILYRAQLNVKPYDIAKT